MANEQILKVYFGRGEYAITSLNVDKMLKAAKEYNDNDQWKTYIWDYLGFHFEKGQLKRYKDVVEVFEKIDDDEKIVELLSEMKRFVTKSEAEGLKINRRKTPEQKAAEKAAKIAAISESNLPDDIKADLLKALN